METKPLFSVLMANYNNGKYIKTAIESVRYQSYKNVEIVIVDDHSTDDSLQIVQQISDLPIRLFSNEENLGCGFTKHKAAVSAKGELCGFLDPDDYLMPEAIEQMVAAHQQEPEASLITSSHYVCDEQLNVRGDAYGACAIPEGESFLSYGKGMTAFATFKRSSYLKTTGIDPTLQRAVDHDLYYKLEEVGATVFLPIKLYKYRVHAGGLSSTKINEARKWSIKAKRAAFERRKSLVNGVRNITERQLNSWQGVLFAANTGKELKRFNLKSAFYWLQKTIKSGIWDKNLGLKLRSFIHNSNPFTS